MLVLDPLNLFPSFMEAPNGFRRALLQQCFGHGCSLSKYPCFDNFGWSEEEQTESILVAQILITRF